jgi:cell wall-associated NlpC family hydrolase
MGHFIRRAAILGLLAGMPWASVAVQVGDSDGSAAADVTPTPGPSPAHIRNHIHLKPSPTVSPGPQADEGDSEAGATPSSRKHRHTDDADASPGQSDADDLASATPRPRPSVAPDATLETDQLQEFSRQPEKIQVLIEAALALTRQNLTYTYGSADPTNGGMDCSGFVYYLLTQAGVADVPRDASGQYSWVRKADSFRAVISRNLDGFELDELKPGDLLFWSGTYKTDRDPPVTHTMIYLGREKETGNRVMAGSSDGRSYHGLERWGVSVFDFKPVSAASPSPGRPAPRFIGYGAIPGL